MRSKTLGEQLTKLAATFRVADDATSSSIFDFLEALNCPRSLTVWLLYENKEFDQLVSLSVNPMDFNCPYRFRAAYTATEFLSKANFFKLTVSKEAAAYKKFFEYEELCKETNRRFSNLALDPLYQGANVWLLNATKRKISEVLGDFSPEEFVDEANWGPGVTTLLKGEHVSAVNKFQSEIGITRDLYSLVSDWFYVAYPRWAQHIHSVTDGRGFQFEKGNSIVTVPKNSKTDRVIASEPGINLWFQKAIGSMIRRRLQRVGIDLNTQEHNQRLSRIGSITSDLVTVDFSSASDSISRVLVAELIEPRWYTLLNATRSVIGIHKGSPIRWEKFSSMGNGFTFELESLIFFAAAKAVCEYNMVPHGTVSVFGDDVVIPTSCYELFHRFCRFLGFRVNMEKSHSSSYFRESCGSHYFDGIDCKPVYLKRRLRNVQDVFKLANNVRLLAHRHNSHYGCDARFLRCWSHLHRRVPRRLRLGIPFGKGDGGFIKNFDESAPVRARDGIEGYYFGSLVDTGIRQYSDQNGLLLARLWCASIQDHGNNYDLRGQTRLRFTRSLAAQWYNLGPWL